MLLKFTNTAQWNHWPTNNETEITRYLGLAGAFSSYLQTGDPNAHKVQAPKCQSLLSALRDYLTHLCDSSPTLLYLEFHLFQKGCSGRWSRMLSINEGSSN